MISSIVVRDRRRTKKIALTDRYGYKFVIQRSLYTVWVVEIQDRAVFRTKTIRSRFGSGLSVGNRSGFVCVEVDYSIGGVSTRLKINHRSRLQHVFLVKLKFFIFLYFVFPGFSSKVTINKTIYCVIAFKIIFNCYKVDFRHIFFSFITTPMFGFGVRM